jgi:DNA-binding beta-propeller fold protein YncE
MTSVRRHGLVTLACVVLTTLALPAVATYVVVGRMPMSGIPSRVAVSSEGEIFVADHDKGQVIVFDAAGVRIRSLNDLGAPLGLAIIEAPASEPPPAEQAPPACVDLPSREEVKQLGLTKEEQRRWKARAKACKRALKETKKDGTKPPPEPQPDPLPIVYVGDETSGSVRIIDNGNIAYLGAGNGEFVKPNGIAVTAGRTVYVVDSAEHRVKVYDRFGVLQSSFGGQGWVDGQLNFPVDIAVNEQLGEVYVTDFWNERVAVFDMAGAWRRNIAAPSNAQGDPAFFRPSGLGIDPAGNLYVVDTALSCVVILDGLGTLIDIIGYDNGQYWTGDM